MDTFSDNIYFLANVCFVVVLVMITVYAWKKINPLRANLKKYLYFCFMQNKHVEFQLIKYTFSYSNQYFHMVIKMFLNE